MFLQCEEVAVVGVEGMEEEFELFVIKFWREAVYILLDHSESSG